MKHALLQMISMLQAMDTDDSPKQGLITTIAKRLNIACSTVYRLWECMVHMCAMGVIISPKLNKRKKFQETAYLSDRELIQESVKIVPLRKRNTQ